MIVDLPVRPASPRIETTACPVVELRQYTLHPGQRDVLIALFEREFLDTQETTGIRVLGQFRDLDAPDRFVWLRGFPDMAQRRASLESFYTGPAWQAHRDAANATMIDSDDVLLLKPVAPASGFALDLSSPHVAHAPDHGGLIVATLYAFDAPVDMDFLEFFAADLHPAVAAAGARVIASFATEYAANTFPRLPVRHGEHVFAWFARFDDATAYARYRETLIGGPGWRAIAVALARRLQGPPQVLRLAPTSRSRLR
ncbi:NIPSNAP family containing protein [Lysobacter dokdonensis DS-58]|uniref:NIPSNAP family containing protein n=1 Tax=Lysobacter dokdonensis DS-58 TaxID=1300345 RepID=A0A0A2WDT5_9GAMM|nr:NIPSNAP family protein [Lysobacter dokdonensis]KGQ18371.1 NIPSNAP family containing protein [Lysobacter dokdonensis DS-58]